MTATDSTQHTLAGELKFCTKCREGKPRTEYHVGKEYPDGRKATCKTCMQSQRRAKYHSQRGEEVLKRRERKASLEWRKAAEERKPAILARQAERIAVAVSPEKVCTACTLTLPAIPDKFHRCATGALGLTSVCKACTRLEYIRRADADRDKYRESARASYRRRRDQILANGMHRRRTDPAHALRMRVSSGVRQSLGRTRLGTSWINLLPYSVLDLKVHLESLFAEGMTWGRLLADEIEIDHVIPVSFFNPATADCIEFRMCWSLKNLQPLWRADNRAKSDSLPSNFTELWNVLHKEATRG